MSEENLTEMIEPTNYECPQCFNVWSVDGSSELGGWTPDNEDDAICPECGGEGDQI